MGDWLKGLGLFLADMYRHTVGKMTGVLSIILALAPVLCPDFFSGDRGLLHSKWAWEVAAAISFFFAAHSAWSEQHKARLEVERKHFDERPQLGLRLIAPSGVENWRSAAYANNQQLVFFSLHHLNGRKATNLHFDPISSHRGGYSLRFLKVPFVNPPVQTSLVFEVWANGIRPTQEVNAASCSAAKLLEFLWDNPDDLPEFRYNLVVRFEDRGEERTQSFPLVFDAARYEFTQP
jgi:hypothetical protein